MNSSAVTKADFCVASRDQPSLAVGIYAYRVVCRSKWMLWSDSYPEFLVRGVFQSDIGSEGNDTYLATHTHKSTHLRRAFFREELTVGHR